VRAHAAWALGEIAKRDPAVRASVDAALARAANDGDDEVRAEVKDAITTAG
jgi:hypothetical protein